MSTTTKFTITHRGLFLLFVLISVLTLQGVSVLASEQGPQETSAVLLGITPTPTSTVTATPEPPTPTPVLPTPTPKVGIADPVIVKYGDPEEALRGEEVTFTIEVTNRGSLAAVDVVVTDEVSPYLEILEVTTTQGTVTVDGQTVTVEVGTVGAGFVVQIVIHTRVREDAPAPMDLENLAVLDSPNGGNRTTQVTTTSIITSRLPQTGASSQQFRWSGLLIAVAGILLIGGMLVWTKALSRVLDR